MSGARSQSAVYLPSCLAISSAKFRPDFHSIGADSFRPNPRLCLRQNACTRHAARPAGGGRRRTRRHGKAPDTQCPALEDNLWFTCPAAWRSLRRSSAPPGKPGGEPRFSFDWGEMNPPQSKVLPPAKRLYAPCGAARRRRAQENAQAWKSAGHSVSGARRQSVVYLPSCLAISSAKFSCFFSMPSPFSKRTAFLKVMVPPRVLATEAIYCSTVMALSFTNSCCSRQFSL